jgi:hypothetical protein
MASYIQYLEQATELREKRDGIGDAASTVKVD